MWMWTRLHINMSVGFWAMRTVEALDESLLRGGAASLVPGRANRTALRWGGSTGSYTLRVNWAMTADLSLETYAMP